MFSNGLFFSIQAEETVRKEPSVYGFNPGMKVAGCGGVWQSSMEKHRKTYGKDRGYPLKARDFHIYVSFRWVGIVHFKVFGGSISPDSVLEKRWDADWISTKSSGFNIQTRIFI